MLRIPLLTVKNANAWLIFGALLADRNIRIFTRLGPSAGTYGVFRKNFLLGLTAQKGLRRQSDAD